MEHCCIIWVEGNAKTKQNKHNVLGEGNLLWINLPKKQKYDTLRKEKVMKQYLNPEIEVVKLSSEDVITTSPGTETPWYEESDGIWEFGINP